MWGFRRYTERCKIMCSLENSAWSVYSRYTSWPLLKITHRPFSSRDVKKLASLAVSLSESLQVSLRCSHGHSFPSVWNICPFIGGRQEKRIKKHRLNLVVLRRVDAAFHEIPSMMFYIRHILFCVTEGSWSRFIFVSLWEKEKEKKEEKKRKEKKNPSFLYRLLFSY